MFIVTSLSQLYEQHGKGIDRTDGEDGVGPGMELIYKRAVLIEVDINSRFV